MKFGFILILLIALLSLLAGTSIEADGVTPPLPQAFYGSLSINGQPAPAGTQVSASGAGVDSNMVGNPITTVANGKYGGAGAIDTKLVVQGFIQEGTPLTFYIDGTAADQTATWHSGVTSQLALSATIGAQPTPTPTPAPTSQIMVYTGTSSNSPFEGILNFFGQNYTYQLDNSGALTKTITLTSPTANLVVTIPRGTILKSKTGDLLTPLEFKLVPDAAAPPEGLGLLTKPVSITPDGATFKPYMSIAFGFRPDDLPARITKQDLSVGYYDSAAGKWQMLNGTLDAVKNTIMANVSHLCDFAVFYPLSPATSSSASGGTTTTRATTQVPTGGIAENVPATTSTTAATSGTPITTSQVTTSTSNNLFVYLTIILALALVSIGLVLLKRKRN